MAAEIMAAKYGAPRDFVTDIQNLTKSFIDEYHGRFMMHEWMGDQVIKACYEKIPPVTYYEFIVNTLQSVVGPNMIGINLNDRGHAHTKDWLEKISQFGYNNSEEVKITPHQIYFERIVKTEAGKLHEDHNEAEMEALNTKAVKLGSFMALQQLVKTLPQLRIGNENGDDMQTLRDKITKVKNDYGENVKRANDIYQPFTTSRG